MENGRNLLSKPSSASDHYGDYTYEPKHSSHPPQRLIQERPPSLRSSKSEPLIARWPTNDDLAHALPQADSPHRHENLASDFAHIELCPKSRTDQWATAHASITILLTEDMQRSLNQHHVTSQSVAEARTNYEKASAAREEALQNVLLHNEVSAEVRSNLRSTIDNAHTLEQHWLNLLVKQQANHDWLVSQCEIDSSHDLLHDAMLEGILSPDSTQEWCEKDADKTQDRDKSPSRVASTADRWSSIKDRISNHSNRPSPAANAKGPPQKSRPLSLSLGYKRLTTTRRSFSDISSSTGGLRTSADVVKDWETLQRNIADKLKTRSLKSTGLEKSIHLRVKFGLKLPLGELRDLRRYMAESRDLIEQLERAEERRLQCIPSTFENG